MKRLYYEAISLFLLHEMEYQAYAKTPDKNVDASVNALSACVSSPYRGGPAGCAAMLSFETLSPAPRSSRPFFFSACLAGVDMLGSVQP